jgi:SAM-dependent methyltransferase
MNTFIHQRLQLLSDPLRLRLLHVLLKAELNVGELTTILQTPQSSISRHLKKLLAQHWISKRNEASTRWYAFRPELLPLEAQKLWDAIKNQDPELFSDDHLRLQSYLSLRSIDSRHFFQNIGIRWREVRSGLFGDSFLLPTLLALLPSTLKIADLGCGTGDTLLALAPFVSTLIGIDQSEEMLHISAQRLNNDTVDLRKGSLESLPLQNQEINTALCMLVLHHVENIEKAFSEISRTLMKNGQLILLDTCAHQQLELQHNLGHKHLGFSSENLQLLALDFSLDFYLELPQSKEALGPPLFLARLIKNR